MQFYIRVVGLHKNAGNHVGICQSRRPIVTSALVVYGIILHVGPSEILMVLELNILLRAEVRY